MRNDKLSFAITVYRPRYRFSRVHIIIVCLTDNSAAVTARRIDVSRFVRTSVYIFDDFKNVPQIKHDNCGSTGFAIGAAGKHSIFPYETFFFSNDFENERLSRTATRPIHLRE